MSPTEQITRLAEVIAGLQSTIGLIQAARECEREQHEETRGVLGTVRDERDELLHENKRLRAELKRAASKLHTTLVMCNVTRSKREKVEQLMAAGGGK